MILILISLDQKFDLIFLDPPYKDKNLSNHITIK